MYISEILGFTTSHFTAHLCSGGRGKFFLIKHREYIKEGDNIGDEITVDNCCSVRLGEIKWHHMPGGEYVSLKCGELDRLIDYCQLELTIMEKSKDKAYDGNLYNYIKVI